MVPNGDGWGIKAEGEKGFRALKETKADAMAEARRIAKDEKAELVIHEKGGSMPEADGGGNHPHPPLG